MWIRKATGQVGIFILFFSITVVYSKPLPSNTPQLEAGDPGERGSASTNSERQWGVAPVGAYGGRRPFAYGRYPEYNGWGSAYGGSYPYGAYPSYGGGFGSIFDSDYGGYGTYPAYPSYGHYGGYGGYHGGYRPYGGYPDNFSPGYYDGYYRRQL